MDGCIALYTHDVTTATGAAVLTPGDTFIKDGRFVSPESRAAPYLHRELLEGDQQNQYDFILLEGDQQSGQDRLLLEGEYYGG